MERNQRNVQRSFNHASIIFWSLGNEAGFGANFEACYKWIKAEDKSRPVQYEQAYQRDPNTDIICHMYPSWESMVRDAKKDLGRPYIMCEYAHAMNNSMGSIGEYNDVFDRYPSLMGGAIWEWQDQGLWNRRDPKHVYLAYGGGFGEVPNDHYFIHKGVVFADRSPKPHYPEMKKAYQ